MTPATGEVLGTFADAGIEDVKAAIAAARRAFETTEWSRNRKLRAQALFEMADRMAELREQLWSSFQAIRVGPATILTPAWGP